MCFIPSVGYPIPVCHISNNSLHSLQKQYLMTLKNKLGFLQTHSHAFSFGPRSFGDIGLNDLRIEAHIRGIENMIRTLSTPGQGQEIIMRFLKTIQLASGLSQPISNIPRYKHLILKAMFTSTYKTSLLATIFLLKLQALKQRLSKENLIAA